METTEGRWTNMQKLALSGDAKSFKANITTHDFKAQSIHGSNLLHFAVNGGDIEIVITVLHHARFLCLQPNVFGEIPLHWATKSDPAIVSLLLSYGSDPYHQDNDGNTPLHWAAESDNLKTIQLLLDFGAPITMQNEDFDTPLDVATQNGNHAAYHFMLRNFDYQ